jgi:hypothetical protein
MRPQPASSSGGGRGLLPPIPARPQRSPAARAGDAGQVHAAPGAEMGTRCCLLPRRAGNPVSANYPPHRAQDVLLLWRLRRFHVRRQLARGRAACSLPTGVGGTARPLTPRVPLCAIGSCASSSPWEPSRRRTKTFPRQTRAGSATETTTPHWRWTR